MKVETVFVLLKIWSVFLHHICFALFKHLGTVLDPILYISQLDDEIEGKWGISVVEIDYGNVDCKKTLQTALNDLIITLN